MASPQQMRGEVGATNLRFGDIIVVLVLLGLLLYAAWKQFPAYAPGAGSRNTPAQSAPQP